MNYPKDVVYRDMYENMEVQSPIFNPVAFGGSLLENRDYMKPG